MSKRKLQIGSASAGRFVLDKFPGMSMLSRGGTANIPYFILNMDITEDQKLRARRGLSRVVSISNPSSLYAYKGKVLFIGDSGGSGRSLYVMETASHSYRKIYDLPYPAKRIYYASIDEFVYFGCKHFIKKLLLSAESVVDFPDINVDTSRMLFDGIEERHISELIKMIPCDYIRFYQSRLIGAVGKKVVFSEPFLYEATREFNYLQFDDYITGIAPSGDVLYVGTRNATYIVAGTLESPEIKKTEIGCMKDSVGYTRFVMDGQVFTVPVWVSLTSIVVGLPGGTILPITADKLDLVYDMDSEAGAVGGNSQVTYVNAPHREMAGSANTRFIMGVIRNGKVIYQE